MKLIQVVQGKIKRLPFRAGKPPHMHTYTVKVWDKTIVRCCTSCGMTHYAMVGYGANVTTWRHIKEEAR